MEQTELLKELNEMLDQYKKFQGFIDRAKAQEGKFSPAVIEKVCLDNQLRMMEVADNLGPMLPEVQAEVSGLHEQLAVHGSASEGSNEALEELELRVAIGEMTESEFGKESKGLKSQVEDAETTSQGLRAQLQELQEVLDRWAELSGAEHAEEEVAEEEPAEEEPAEEEPAAEEPAAEEEAEEEPAEEEPAEEEPAEEEPAEEEAGEEEPAEEDEDLLVLEEGKEESEGEIDPLMDEPIHEASLSEFPGGHGETDVEMAFGEQPRAGDTFAFDPESMVPGEDDGPLASEELALGLADQAESEPEIGSDSVPVEVEEGGDEPVLELHEKAEEALQNGADDGTRRALLLYQEGTPEEQSYPFTGDEITIGRGRDNDIQIKNDSKVSRRHCRLFRKEGAFYIQDNKSSNGSLVNGELITERRLFGGEEVIVGETFFRFRIMD